MQYNQRGQILLIVVLVMVTALTVGLSVAVRSISNTRTSLEDANSEQAFSAAEAGIEKSLTTNSAVPNTSFSNGSTYSTTISTVGGPSFALNNGSPVLKDEPADLWLSTYPGYTSQRTGNITIYWGSAADTCTSSETTNSMAALEIFEFTGTAAAPTEAHVAVDPCAARRLVNSFQNVGTGGTVGGTTYRFSTTMLITSGLFLRIVPLYAPTALAVTGCDAANANCTDFPVQGTLIQSVGKVANTQRKIQTYRYYAQLPSELLQYSFFVPQ